MRRSFHRPGLILVALTLAIAACGDDEGGDDSGAGTASPATPVADDGCEDSPRHSTRAVQEARGFVVACLSEDETSVRVTNVSSHVLMVNSTPGVTSIEPAGVEQDVGVQAALGVTGIGWTSSRDHFVLPLQGTLVASGPGPAVVNIRPNLVLTAQANSARYVGEWLSSFVQARGRALARKVQGCVDTAADFVQSSEYVGDVLRSALGAAHCGNALADALREEGRDPSFELPRARKAILKISQPVAEDRLVSFAAKVLAR